MNASKFQGQAIALYPSGREKQVHVMNNPKPDTVVTNFGHFEFKDGEFRWCWDHSVILKTQEEMLEKLKKELGL